VATSGGAVSTSPSQTGAPTPLTTKGDILAWDAGLTPPGPNRFPAGANGQLIVYDSTQTIGLAYASPLTNPMTNVGDIIVGGTAGAANRLGAGSAGQVLTISGGTPAWAGVPGGGLTLIDQRVLAVDTALVEFFFSGGSPITSYTSLMITVLARCTGAVTSDDIYLQFNADTGANYTRQFVAGTGTGNATTGQGVSTAKASIAFIPGANGLANAAGRYTIMIPNYGETNFLKAATSFGFTINGSGVSSIENLSEVLVWNSTAAITEVLMGMVNGSKFKAGSIFTLYGML